MILQQITKSMAPPSVEVHWLDESTGEVISHGYSNSMMAQLRAVLGAAAAQHEALISEVEATYVPPPTAVPRSITRAQGKAALIRAGLWQGVLDYVAAVSDPTERALAEVALHDTQAWERDSPFLNSAAAGIGLAAAQLDDLFIQADAIEL